MMFAAVVGHRSDRATPSLRDAPQRQSIEIVGRETIYRNRNAVQTNPATSMVGLPDEATITHVTSVMPSLGERANCCWRDILVQDQPQECATSDFGRPTIGWASV